MQKQGKNMTIYSNMVTITVLRSLLYLGVPRTHAFYGKYAYRYGAPNVDADFVIVGFILAVSAFQYFYQYYRHYLILERYALLSLHSLQQLQCLPTL
jgi:hypothetical protein